MRISKAEVRTEHAVSYMKQLCRHWGHKFAVEFDDERATIELPKAVCVLDASAESLRIRLELVEDADWDRVEQVVEEHVQRFAFGEELVFAWAR